MSYDKGAARGQATYYTSAGLRDGVWQTVQFVVHHELPTCCATNSRLAAQHQAVWGHPLWELLGPCPISQGARPLPRTVLCTQGQVQRHDKSQQKTTATSVTSLVRARSVQPLQHKQASHHALAH